VKIWTMYSTLTNRQLALSVLAVWLAFLSLYLALPGCAAGITDAQRVAYAQEEQRCEANEDAIIARTGSTYADDSRDLEAERERCNAALHTILGMTPASAPVDGGAP